jgi:hypothetical protein
MKYTRLVGFRAHRHAQSINTVFIIIIIRAMITAKFLSGRLSFLNPTSTRHHCLTTKSRTLERVRRMATKAESKEERKDRNVWFL